MINCVALPCHYLPVIRSQAATSLSSTANSFFKHVWFGFRLPPQPFLYLFFSQPRPGVWSIVRAPRVQFFMFGVRCTCSWALVSKLNFGLCGGLSSSTIITPQDNFELKVFSQLQLDSPFSLLVCFFHTCCALTNDHALFLGSIYV